MRPEPFMVWALIAALAAAGVWAAWVAMHWR
jgi:hypothetical protein